MPPHISEWEWDDGNLTELATHGVDVETVLEVWTEAPRYRKNTRGRPGYRMIGPDWGGEIWTIPTRPVRGRPGVWRAVTGWRSEEPDISWYRRKK